MLINKKCKYCEKLFYRKRSESGKLYVALEKQTFCSKSCARSSIATSHGMSHTPTHSTWLRIKNRCTNKNTQYYYLYGGRGIKVCKRWDNFENFLKDMGVKPKGTSIDRINNNKGYSPSNCRWATMVEQMNNKRTNVKITFNGETKTIAEWARYLNMNYSTLYNRLIIKKWDYKKAFHV